MKIKKAILLICFSVLCACLFLFGTSAQTDDSQLEEIYAEIRASILAGEDSVDLTHFQIPRNELGEIFQAFCWENPDVAFCLKDGVTYSFSESDNIILKVNLVYDDKESVLTRYEWLNATVDTILSDVNEDWSDLQKLLWINNYVCDNFRYELSTGNRTAYEMLVSGEGVCEAYTNVFNLLAQRCGIPVSYCYSEELEHVWSMVQLNGNWYHVDATWNDNRVSTYRYFLLSEAADRAARSDEMFDSYARYDALDTTYDNAFWRVDCNSSFVFIGEDTYCVYDKQIVEVDLTTLQTQAVTSLPAAEWRAPGTNSVYVKKFYDLAVIGDMLLFNLPSEIYGYSLANGQTTLLYTSTESTEIYCLREYGTAVRVGYCSQVESDVMYYREATLPGVYTVEYYLDGALYLVQTYCRGWSLSMPEPPMREHYAFLGWSDTNGRPVTSFGKIYGSYLLDSNVSEIIFLSDGQAVARVWVERGSEITLPSMIPTKDSDAYYHYIFSGWTGYTQGMKAQSPYVTIEATYEQQLRTYTVTYLVEGEVFLTQTVTAGTLLKYTDQIPEKEELKRFRYEFREWIGAPEGTEVLKDITLKATFVRHSTDEDSANGSADTPAHFRNPWVLVGCMGGGLFVLVLLIGVIFRSRRRY